MLKAMHLRTRTECIPNRNGANNSTRLKKLEKSVLWNVNYMYKRMHASKILYQSAYQGFGNEAT